MCVFLQFLAVGSGTTLESVRVIILSIVVGRTLLVTTKYHTRINYYEVT